MNNLIFDIAVIGGGIIGTSAAMQLSLSGSCTIALLEAEESLAAHQTGHNSGVIHSGLYYKPGSLKALNCIEGRESLYKFCSEHDIPFERCGKIVAAVNDNEIPALEALEKKGKANGLTGLKRLSASEIKEIEPYVCGIEGLFVPQTGIVDYKLVTNKFAEIFKLNKGKIFTGTKLNSIIRRNNYLTLITSKGRLNCRYLVNCGGLYSDRIAKLSGINPEVRIIPFRGEYYKLKDDKKYLVRNLIYPVPDPEFPFLGVHFTRMINGNVEAGPNAVLAFKREGYKKTDFSFYDTAELLLYPGFIKMASKYYRMGFGEFYRSFNKTAFVKALQKLIPSITAGDLIKGGAGVRAQALRYDGRLSDDFCIQQNDNVINILNAPSPAATASISIGRKISEIVYSNIS